VRVEHAHYFPHYGVIIDQRGNTLHSPTNEARYVTPDLLQLPHVASRNGQSVLQAPEQPHRLPQCVVTMPWGAIHNYGHFVLDCLPSIASFLELRDGRDLPFVFPALKPWQRDHLGLLGITPVELPHEHYVADQILYATCMADFLCHPNVNLRRVAELQCGAVGGAPGGDRKIYLSRLGYQTRIFQSERQLEHALAARGFDIIKPETLSVREQISAFMSARVIVGSSGAAFANALYCAPGAIVVEIVPRPQDPTWVRNICVMMNLRWAPYWCDSLPPEKPVMHGGQIRPTVGITFDIDHADFLAHLDRAADL
jgi:capsular polysaccharide biosynthesis protein